MALNLVLDDFSKNKNEMAVSTTEKIPIIIMVSPAKEESIKKENPEKKKGFLKKLFGKKSKTE